MIKTPKDILKYILVEKLLIDEEELALCMNYFHKDIILKDSFFIKEATPAEYIGIIIQGCTRTYITDDNLKESTLFFSFENEFLGDMKSFHFSSPSDINIQAIENTVVYKISKNDFETLGIKVPKFKNWYSVSAIQMYIGLFEKLKEAKIWNPKEKYVYLMKHKPYILQRVPLKYIAAYLGIEPQSLSRLRKSGI